MKTTFLIGAVLLCGALAPVSGFADESRQIPIDDMDNWYCEYFAGRTEGSLEGPRKGGGSPGQMAFDVYGNAYVAAGSTVFVYTPDDQVHRVAGIPGLPGAADGSADLACLAGVNAIACHPTDNIVYVSDYGNRVIKKLVRGADGRWSITTVAGQVGKSGHRDGPGPEALLQRVDGIALDSKGNLYMMDQDWLRRLSPDGQLVTLNPKGGTGAFGPGLEHDLESAKFWRIVGAGSLACDENDNLLVADKWNGTFDRVDFKAGKVIILAGGPARDSPGFRNSIQATDGPGNSVAVFHTGGGPGGLNYDRLTKRVYTTTADEHAIRAIMPDGMVKTLGPWIRGPFVRIAEGPLKQTRGGGWIAGVDMQGRVYLGTRPGMIYRFYRKPGIAGAPAVKTPNPLLPWPVSSQATSSNDGVLKVAFDKPAAGSTNLLASPPVDCAAPRGAVEGFAAQVTIGALMTNVVFAPQQAALPGSTLTVREDLVPQEDGYPESHVKAEFRAKAEGGATNAVVLDLATASRPVVVSDGKRYVVAFEENKTIRVVRISAEGKLMDASPIRMGERWQRRPAIAFNGQTVAILGTRQPQHNPWGWGGPPATCIGRLAEDGKTPDNLRLQDNQITEGGFPSLIDHVNWKGRQGWPAGTRGGFKDTETGYWPGIFTTLAWDGQSWVAAWMRYRVRNTCDMDIFACRVDPNTMMAIGEPVLVAGGPAEPGAQTQPALVGLGEGRSLLVYLGVPPDGQTHVQARLISGGALKGEK